MTTETKVKTDSMDANPNPVNGVSPPGETQGATPPQSKGKRRGGGQKKRAEAKKAVEPAALSDADRAELGELMILSKDWGLTVEETAGKLEHIVDAYNKLHRT